MCVSVCVQTFAQKTQQFRLRSLTSTMPLGERFSLLLPTCWKWSVLLSTRIIKVALIIFANHSQHLFSCTCGKKKTTTIKWVRSSARHQETTKSHKQLLKIEVVQSNFFFLKHLSWTVQMQQIFKAGQNHTMHRCYMWRINANWNVEVHFWLLYGLL